MPHLSGMHGLWQTQEKPRKTSVGSPLWPAPWLGSRALDVPFWRVL